MAIVQCVDAERISGEEEEAQGWDPEVIVWRGRGRGWSGGYRCVCESDAEITFCFSERWDAGEWSA